jgi:hypothetical protein
MDCSIGCRPVSADDPLVDEMSSNDRDNIRSWSSPVQSSSPPLLCSRASVCSSSGRDTPSPGVPHQSGGGVGYTDGGSHVGGGRDKVASVQPMTSSSSSASLNCADDSPLLAGVTCRLETKELWDKFYELGTEMIITKSGR